MTLPNPLYTMIQQMMIAGSTGNSLSDLVAHQAGRWAVGQLFGSAAAAGPLGLVGGVLIGGLLGGLFRRRRRPQQPQLSPERQVVAESPYTVLAQELPRMQEQINKSAMTELLSQVSAGFGGNKLVAGQARDAVLQSFAQMIPQLQQQKMQTLFNLSQLGAQDRMNRRQIAASLLDRQMQIQGQLALQKLQTQNALTSSLLGIVLQQAFSGLNNRG